MNFEDEVRTNLFAYMDEADRRIRRVGWWAFALGLCAGVLLGVLLK